MYMYAAATYTNCDEQGAGTQEQEQEQEQEQRDGFFDDAPSSPASASDTRSVCGNHRIQVSELITREGYRA
jgi:hypothetical protein